MVNKVEFFDRERETREIMQILESEPRVITFIYGPINSGKTTLITNLIENLPDNYAVIYINLRERAISSYRDFLEAIFDVKYDKYEGISGRIMGFLGRQKDTFNDVISDLGKTQGIPIPKGIFSRIFREEKPKDAFIYILKSIREIKNRGKTPIFIIDELQKIGDTLERSSRVCPSEARPHVKVANYLIYDVFNFFIRLTKELHICHVFALSSDSLFIEKVYSEAMLHGRARYLKVDDFDKKTAKEFLKNYKFNREEISIAYDCAGGKPGYLINLISAKETGKNIVEYTKEMIENRKNMFLFMFAENKEKKSEILKIFKNFKQNNEIKFDEDINIEILKFLIGNNILFIDAATMNIKPQSRVDLIVIREIMKDA